MTDDAHRIINRIVAHAAGLSRESLLELAEVAASLAEREGVAGPRQVLTPREALAEVTGDPRT